MIQGKPSGEQMSLSEILDQILDEVDRAIALAEQAGHETLVQRLKDAQAMAEAERKKLAD